MGGLVGWISESSLHAFDLVEVETLGRLVGWFCIFRIAFIWGVSGLGSFEEISSICIWGGGEGHFGNGASSAML